MTTARLSVDNRGPSAIYIVSDSRITWGSPDKRWDSGRKVFAMKSADVFGYCGEVLFPSLVLGQLSDLIDRGLLWPRDRAAENRHSIILKYLKTSFERRHDAPNHDFTIIHCAREGDGLACKFHAWRIGYEAANKSWSNARIDVSRDGKSRLLAALGSGKKHLEREIRHWNDTAQGGTARAIFSAFCDALVAGEDPLSGGMPQLVSLDRRTGGKCWDSWLYDVRYIYGLPVEALPALANMEWVGRLEVSAWRLAPAGNVTFDESRPLAFFASLWTCPCARFAKGETTNDLFGFLTSDCQPPLRTKQPWGQPSGRFVIRRDPRL